MTIDFACIDSGCSIDLWIVSTDSLMLMLCSLDIYEHKDRQLFRLNRDLQGVRGLMSLYGLSQKTMDT